MMPARHALGLAGLLVLLLAGLAWTPPIVTRGEAREATVVRQIVRQGEWILPRRDGHVPSKPLLYHWLAAGVARTSGSSDSSMRAPSAVAAWGMCVATILVGTALGGSWVGWTACSALLGMWGFWASALEARVDMVFAALVTLSVAAGLSFTRGGSTWARALCYFAAAAAVLAKGPAGVVLPALILATWRLAAPDDGGRRLWSTPLAIVAAAPVVLWYALAYRAGGDEFVAVQLVHENLQRLVGTGSFARQRQHHPLKLVGAFALHLFPWNLAVVPAGLRAIRHRRDDAADVLLLLWWAVPLLVFTLAAGKRSVYLLPAYPAVALIAARALAPRLAGRGRLAGAVAVATTAVVVCASTAALRLHVARTEPLVPFAHRLQAELGAADAVAVTWSVEENDRQVLEYLLDRPLPRRARGEAPAGRFIASLPLPPALARRCTPALPATVVRGQSLALVACGDAPAPASGVPRAHDG